MTLMLWAQPVAPAAEFLSLGALVGVAFFVFLTVAVVGGVRSDRRKAEIAHAETLKRLELGIPDPPSDRSWPLALVCIVIGAGVPAIAFGVTLAAYLNKANVADEIWIAPAVASIVSVAVAGKLASMLHRETESDRNPASAPKLVGDPDAFDVAGRRG